MGVLDPTARAAPRTGRGSFSPWTWTHPVPADGDPPILVRLSTTVPPPCSCSSCRSSRWMPSVPRCRTRSTTGITSLALLYAPGAVLACGTCFSKDSAHTIAPRPWPFARRSSSAARTPARGDGPRRSTNSATTSPGTTPGTRPRAGPTRSARPSPGLRLVRGLGHLLLPLPRRPAGSEARGRSTGTSRTATSSGSTSPQGRSSRATRPIVKPSLSAGTDQNLDECFRHLGPLDPLGPGLRRRARGCHPGPPVHPGDPRAVGSDRFRLGDAPRGAPTSWTSRTPPSAPGPRNKADLTGVLKGLHFPLRRQSRTAGRRPRSPGWPLEGFPRLFGGKNSLNYT